VCFFSIGQEALLRTYANKTAYHSSKKSEDARECLPKRFELVSKRFIFMKRVWVVNE
jgi:hypothetical protein